MGGGGGGGYDQGRGAVCLSGLGGGLRSGRRLMAGGRVPLAAWQQGRGITQGSGNQGGAQPRILDDEIPFLKATGLNTEINRFDQWRGRLSAFAYNCHIYFAHGPV